MDDALKSVIETATETIYNTGELHVLIGLSKENIQLDTPFFMFSYYWLNAMTTIGYDNYKFIG